MQRLAQLPETHRIELDLCLNCHLVWLDTGEWKDLSELYETKLRRLRAAQNDIQKEYALAVYQMASQKGKIAKSLSVEQVDIRSTFYAIISIFGFPVEEDRDTFKAQPWLTWALIGLCTAISLIAFMYPEFSIKHFAFSVNKPWAERFLTAITSFFVHGNPIHLAGNLYFLWIFGDNVEDHLGKKRYILLLLASTLAGNLAFACLDPRASNFPVVGASGGIFGVISFYLVSFPYRRFVFFAFTRWMAVPGVLFAVVFVFFNQVLGVLLQVTVGSSTSYLSHAGGAVIGIMYALVVRMRNLRFE